MTYSFATPDEPLARFWVALLVFFESWARAAYGISFLFNGFNVQSIAMFAAVPLLLGLGQTYVIISGGIDLSVGSVLAFAGIGLEILRHTVAVHRRQVDGVSRVSECHELHRPSARRIPSVESALHIFLAVFDQQAAGRKSGTCYVVFAGRRKAVDLRELHVP